MGTRIRLTKPVAQALQPRERTYIVYDADLPGFGVRVTKAGSRAWIFDYRPGGGRRASTRRITLGRVETLAAPKARSAAEQLHARVRLGADPAQERDERRSAATLSELADRFLAEEVRPKRAPGTYQLYATYFRVHLRPALGSRRAREVTRADIARLHRAIGERTAPTANRVVTVLSGLYSWAERAGEVPEGTNPAKRAVTRFREEGRERFLTGEELGRLGDALVEAETVGLPWTVDEGKPKAKHAPTPENRREILSPHLTAAIRLLLFTGCRLREILHLKWENVDFERAMLFLPTSKTGRRPVHLSAAAMAVLAKLNRVGPYVVPGNDLRGPRHDLHRPWRAICRRAGLDCVRIHDLRHTFGSIGAAGGFGLVAIGKLLGHSQASTTERYAHLDADPLRRAVETIGTTIAASLERRDSDNVVRLKSG